MSKRRNVKEIPYGLRALVSLSSWVFVLIFTVFFFTTTLILVLPVGFLFDRGKRGAVHFMARLWAMAILTGMPFWRMKVLGKRHLVPGRNYVIVGNHQSMMDILLALAGLPLHFKFLAKAELFPIPFFGWHMLLAGYIPLVRGDRQSGQEAMLHARDWLRRGVSVLFFPEGTRSLDGEIHSFKQGAFKIAKEEGIEVLPVVIDGTGDAVPKRSLILKKPSHFVLSIGKPFRIGARAALDRVREETRREMSHRLRLLRGTAA